MDKGLDLILKRIRETPRSTLIDRYVSLVQDLEGGEARRDRMLQLAQVLARSQPDQALSIAQNLHRAFPDYLPVYDVLVEAFKAKGRFAKAAILKAARDKLERRRQGGKPIPLPQVAVRPAGVVPESPGGSESTGLKLQLDDVDDALLPLTKRAGGQPADGASPSPILGSPLFELESAARQSIETQQVVMGEAMDGRAKLGGAAPLSGEPESATFLPLEGAAPPIPMAPSVVRGPGFGHSFDPLSPKLRQQLAGRLPGDTILALNPTQNPPSNPNPGKGRSPTVSSLDGPVRSALKAPLPHWQLGGSPLFELARRWPPQGEEAHQRDDWSGVGETPLHRARSSVLPASPMSSPMPSLGSSSPASRHRPLPKAFVKAMMTLDQRFQSLDPAALLALKWDLFQGLWGTAPGRECADLLRAMHLQRVTPGFWGLYLDSLLASGSYRAALLEIKRTLPREPHLSWARVGFVRLPQIWRGLRIRGFNWREDEGVPVLMTRLAERPVSKAAALLGLRARPKKPAL